jgi:hypothetical protein
MTLEGPSSVRSASRRSKRPATSPAIDRGYRIGSKSKRRGIRRAPRHPYGYRPTGSEPRVVANVQVGYPFPRCPKGRSVRYAERWRRGTREQPGTNGQRRPIRLEEPRDGGGSGGAGEPRQPGTGEPRERGRRRGIAEITSGARQTGPPKLTISDDSSRKLTEFFGDAREVVSAVRARGKCDQNRFGTSFSALRARLRANSSASALGSEPLIASFILKASSARAAAR